MWGSQGGGGGKVRERMNEGIKGLVGIWALLGSYCIPGIQASSALQEILQLISHRRIWISERLGVLLENTQLGKSLSQKGASF